MKKTILILTLFTAINWSFSQGTDILSAEQFCSGNSQLTFNNVYGGTDFTPVGCLGSIPNASYFYMVIDQPGDLYFDIDQEDLFGNPIDVDFIAWGPFTDINDANTNISYTDCAACPNNTTDPTFYPYATDIITDCSFDIAPTELMSILNALPGQVYVVLITNFDGDEGIINFQQSGGGGTTSCLSLPVCGNVYIDAGGTTNNYAGDETTTITPYFAGGTVTVDFTVVDIPDAGDVLTVYNGPDNSYPVLGTVSGLPAIFTSSVAGNPTGAITFEFISDNDSNVGTGWEADITCDPPPAPPSCGETFYDNGGAGGNYVANESQVANIFPDTPGDIITVTFTAFNTESGNDVLTVYDGPNTTYPLIGNYSGTTIPGPFTSTDLSGSLTFVFTSNNTIQSSGWAADITCFTPPTCGNTFYDSGGPSGDYISNELETTTFFPDTPGDVVTATFTAFYTEFIDDLYVYDGPDDSYPLIGVFSGTTIPGPFTSTDASGALTFVFDSDGSVEYSGWEANLTCSTPVCGSTVYDSGGAGGNYAANETTTTTYYPDTAGYLVTTTFTAFNTQNGTDILTIYDGPDATYPLLGAFSGTTIPGAFTSSDLTTGALTFVFTSNGSIQNSGWSADITCVPLPDCGSTFYDSGGSSGNYSPSELETTTFFPDFPGDIVVVTFTAFNIEDGYDDLYVYDGPDDTYPLIGIFTGSVIPGPFTSTDPSGALTFVFDSDGSYQLSGWAADITCISLCDDYITATTDGENCGEGTIDLNATATSGATDFYWYTTASGGTPIATTLTGDWITPIITSTTTYYVSVYNGTCESDRIPIVANILPEPSDVTISSTPTPIGATGCNLQYAELTASGGEFSNAITQTVLELDFESGLTDNISGTWSTVNNSTGGTPANAAWTIRPDSYYAFIYTFNSNDTSNFILSDSDDQGSGGSTNTELTSPVYSLEFFTSASLSYYHHYNDFGGTDNARVEISTDGGTTWETATPLRQYTTDQGDSDDFTQDTIDLSAYLGQTTLQIRFKYTAAWDIFWAIDNITLEGEMNIPSSDIIWSPTNGLFTDASLTTPYNGDPAATVYAAPNGTQIYTATAEGLNGCIKTETVSITRNGKTWNGSQDSNWYVANNWTPSGVPTIDDCIEIPDNALVPNYPITDKFQTPPPIPPLPAQARNVTLLDGAYIEIETNTELIIQEWLDVQGSAIFNLKSSASLIQIEDTATNTGNIHMQRSPNFDGSAIAGSEYVYWSSPVDNFQVNAISPGSAQLYYWQATVAGNGVGNHGNWYGASGTMEDGAGYIVKGLAGTPTTIPTTAYAVPNNTALFSGVPKNGVLTRQIFHGGYNGGPYAGVGNTATNEDDNWNLIGNPYPSAISANAFTNLNTNINGTVYLWDHNGAAVSAIDPFYENYVYNYDDNDYIEHNNTGSNPPGINDLFIASGQAFFVLMNNSASSGSNVTFNNSMRQAIPNYNNNVFSRNSETEESQNYNEKHRIWFDLLSPNNVTNSILVGYVHNATNSFDRLYDGYDFSSGDNSGFYSILDNEGLSIQGRALPFSEEDTVPLGIIANETGSHTITINTVDGLFLNETQNIYIEDTALNIIHDIRISPYQFTIGAGVHNDRFILRYTNNNLSIKDLDTISGIKVFEENDQLVVTSEHGTIASIDVYDILGRILFYNHSINLDRYQISEISPKNATLLLRIKLVNGQQKIAKVIF
jgi:Ig-like domain CHU_C associated/CUB domain